MDNEFDAMQWIERTVPAEGYDPLEIIIEIENDLIGDDLEMEVPPNLSLLIEIELRKRY